MNVLQGRYLKKINSKSGKFKGLKIKTKDGTQTVYLPKALRAIAQQELTLGDHLRVWTTQRKKGPKVKKKGKSSGTLWALQLIPLSPKTAIVQEIADSALPKANQPGVKASKAKSSHSKQLKKAKKKKAPKPMTVQLCQKKNCCKRGGTQLWSAFESANNAAKAMSSAKTFQLEAVGCLGGCKNGPNIRFLPDNVKHYHVRPKDVETLLAKHR